MKKIVSLLFVFAFILTACTGDQGPMGPPGSDGNDGGISAFSAFEIDIDFNADNGFSHIEDYGNGFNVADTNVTLVYMLWETNDRPHSWRLLPQSEIFEDGTLIYNYDFTKTNVHFFLDGTKDPETLDPIWTQQQAFRVVVVPADNIGMDPSNLQDVMQLNNIKSFDIK